MTSLKDELEIWAKALKYYDEKQFELALEEFATIADTSKIFTNIGLIHATIGRHEEAVDYFNQATDLDKYLAVAYFQCGVSNFLLRRYQLAFADFNKALEHLRSNQFINYEQLGLDFRLYSAEVLFNKGLSLIYMGKKTQGLEDLRAASQAKEIEGHNVIDEAIQDGAEGYTVFSIPVGKLYRPPENKLRNVKAKDYMGKAKLVAASDSRDIYTTFVGSTRLKQGLNPSGAPLLETERQSSSPPKDSTSDLSRSRTAAARIERSNTRSNSRGPPLAGTDLAKSISVGAPRVRADSAGANIQPPSRSPPPPFGAPVRALTVRKTNGEVGRRPSAAEGGSGRSSPRSGQTAMERRPSVPQIQRPPREPVRAATIDVPRVSSERKPRGVTEFYDDYLGLYEQPGDEMPPDVPAKTLNSGGGEGAGAFRVAAWANNTMLGASPNIPPSRTPSQRIGQTDARGPTLSSKLLSGLNDQARAPLAGTGRYTDDGTRMSTMDYGNTSIDLSKIRVKLHYKGDVRGMTFTPDTTFEDFVDKVMTKFDKRYGELGMKFTDVDGAKITLRDGMDFEFAIETAKESAGGRPEGKLEVWLTDE